MPYWSSSDCGTSSLMVRIMASPTYSGEDETSGIACPTIGADQARDLVGIADGQAPMGLAAPLAGRVGRHKSGNALAIIEMIEVHSGSLQKRERTGLSGGRMLQNGASDHSVYHRLAT